MSPRPLSGASQVGDAWGAALMQGSFPGTDKGELAGPPLVPRWMGPALRVHPWPQPQKPGTKGFSRSSSH